MTTAVYTANYGHVDEIALPVEQTVETDWLVYGADAEGWVRRELPAMARFSNIEQSRIPKALSTTVLPEYDITIWTCGLVKVTASDFVEWCVQQLGSDLVAVYQHDNKRTVRSELDACKDIYHKGHLVGGQAEYYAALKVDMSDMVPCCNIIVRRRDPRLRAFEAEWMLHQLLFCSNDQICMTSLMKQYGIPYHFIDGSVFESDRWMRSRMHSGKSDHATQRAKKAEVMQ